MKNAMALVVCSISVFVNFANEMPSPKGNIVVNQGKSEDSSSKMTFTDNDILIPQDENKMLEVNINEVLWLKKKYNIVRIRSGCIPFPETELAIAKQEQEVFLKYGNTFWQRIKAEVDSIEFHHLGYQKANINALEVYLNKNNFTTKQLGDYVGYVKFTIQPYGQLSNIDINTKAPVRPNFTKERRDTIRKKLTQLLSKAPLCRPSHFLNQPIIDSTRIYISQVN